MFGHGYFGAGYFGSGYWGPGTSAPSVTHDTAGDLVGAGARIVGSAAGSGITPGPHGESAYDKPYRVLHSTSGALIAQSAVVRGTAEVTRTGQNTLALLLIAV